MLSIAQQKSNNVFHIGSYAILCLLLPALVVASAFLLEQNVIYILLAAPAIVAIVYRLPHVALIAMSLSVMFVESLHFNLGLLPRQVTWIGDAVILLIAARAFIFGKAKLGRAQDPFRVPLLLFGAVFLCSTLLNSVSLAVTLVTIRQYFKYIILYLAITGLPLSSRHISQSLRFLFFLILAQVPIVFIAFLMGVRGDYLSGGLGLGGTAPLGFLCIAAANVFISRYIHGGRLLDLLKFAAVSAVPAMSEIKFGIIILPVSIICTILLAFSSQRKRAFVTLAVSIPLLLGATIAYSRIYPEIFEKFGSWSFWSGYMHQEYDAEDLQGGIYLGRAARMRVAASHVTGSLDAAVVGVGPGETGDSFFDAGKGSLYDTVLGAASQLEFTRVLLELGIPGVIMLMWIMVRLPRGLAGLYRFTTASRDKALICGLFGTSVISILYAFYMPVLSYTEPTAYLFWLSAAFLSVSMNEMREQRTS
ncbi:MAG: hypothetical protein ACYSWO_17045 [Planctomycetota bacterium]|jgi:hypothetical protein